MLRRNPGEIIRVIIDDVRMCVCVCVCDGANALGLLTADADDWINFNAESFQIRGHQKSYGTLELTEAKENLGLSDCFFSGEMFRSSFRQICRDFISNINYFRALVREATRRQIERESLCLPISF